MARYADIDDLLINKSHCDRDGSRFVYCDDIEPTADVVEVVRCKDCRFWKTETEPIGIECEPGEYAHYCDIDDMISRSGNFCSYGERREDGSN